MSAGTANSADIENEDRLIKSKIIKAATQLFEEKGLNNTSIGEIAELAGVSVPTAYGYVKRKAEIMLLLMEDFTEGLKNRILSGIYDIDNHSEKLTKAINIFYQNVADREAQVLLLYRESQTMDKQGRAKIMKTELEYVDLFKEILDQGVKQNVFKPHDTGLTALSILVLGHAWVLKRWHLKKQMSFESYVKSQTEFILGAITA